MQIWGKSFPCENGEIYMDFFDVLTLIGGLALFLYGMNVMGSRLEKRAGHKLKPLLEKATSNPVKGLFLGILITALMQSSSVTTVMVVGFVNSGIMTLSQSVPVIMGANLGAAITNWILSLSGISGGSFFLQLLKPSSFTPIVALIGVIMHNFIKKERTRDVGGVLMGFAILMYGMEIMSGSVSGLRNDPNFTGMLTVISNPLVGVLVGVVITAVIQSSSASIGIMQALSATGAITYNIAIPVIMGQNIGTCVSAIISCIGAGKNAKRAAAVHLLFNVLSMLICLPLYFIVYSLAGLTFGDDAVNPVTIALINTIYKVISLVIIIPVSGILPKLARFFVRDTKETGTITLLDERLIKTPAVAVDNAEQVMFSMAHDAVSGVKDAIRLLSSFDEKLFDTVRAKENQVDVYEDKLGTYLVKLSAGNLARADSRKASMLLKLISDFERISDHSVGIAVSAEEISEKRLAFSDEAKSELKVIIDATSECLDLALGAFLYNDLGSAATVEPLEQVIDKLREDIQARHIERLKAGECTIELGFVLTDLITSLERISDHCSNIAGCILEMSHDDLKLHESLHNLRHSGEGYDKLYEEFSKRYALN